MKVFQINTFSNGSTGTIMMNIHKELEKQNIESYVAWARGRKTKNNSEIAIGNKLDVYAHGIYSRLTDKTGFASTNATKKLLKKIDEIKPDIIHLHNIHGYYINIKLLFEYIKQRNIKTVWTLHDCWSFTGHCAYFDMAKCDKWKTHCEACPQNSAYPKSIVDNSYSNYENKRNLFTNANVTIVTPSNWLAKLVKQSYLKEYEVKVINNGIDREIFKKRESDFRKKYNIENKKMILGVASVWDKRKGLDDFIKLSKIIDDNYQIVLVGLNEKQLKKLPSNIIGLSRTENAIQLAEIYSTADVFFNPTYEENFPTTNIEALACGTPVITYNTGGSPEMLNESNGKVVNYELFEENYKAIIDASYNVKFDEKLYKEAMVANYLKLYNEVVNREVKE